MTNRQYYETYIKENYADKTPKQIYDHLNISRQMFYRIRNQLGLENKHRRGTPLTDEDKIFIEKNYKSLSNVKMGRILKKSPSVIQNYYSSLGLSKQNRLKVALPDGHESEHFDKSGNRIVKVKYKNRYIHKQRYLWIMEHGSVPKGMVVVLKDKDLGVVLSNLELKSRSQHLRDISRRGVKERIKKSKLEW